MGKKRKERPASSSSEACGDDREALNNDGHDDVNARTRESLKGAARTGGHAGLPANEAEVGRSQEASNRSRKKRRKDKKKKKRKEDGLLRAASGTKKSADPTPGEDHVHDDDEPEQSDTIKATGPVSESGAPHAEFPFEVDPDDHCESPLEAYQDVAFLLRSSACKSGKSTSSSSSPSTPTIYDPYYCHGAVVRNLNELGFDNVYNRNEDCYAVWSAASQSSSTKSNSSISSPTLPTFDVLVTNPPYSSDHIEKLLQFVTSPAFGDRPWFLLLPNWVVKKDYYEQLVLSKRITPFYVVPRKRYVYLPPPQYRPSKASDTHKKSSPFVSMWYVWGGTHSRTDLLVKEFYRYHQQTQGKGAPPACDLARSKSALRDLRRKKR